MQKILYIGLIIVGRRFFTEKEIPNLYKEIKVKIQEQIDICVADDGYLSFTTDIWPRESGQGAIISLTVHSGADDNKSRVLQIAKFDGSHTGKTIGEKLLAPLDDWNIPIDRVHAIVCDNGPNMQAGIRHAELQVVSCAIHTISGGIRYKMTKVNCRCYQQSKTYSWAP